MSAPAEPDLDHLVAHSAWVRRPRPRPRPRRAARRSQPETPAEAAPPPVPYVLRGRVLDAKARRGTEVLRVPLALRRGTLNAITP
jgi:hypothetical protein